MRRTRRVRRRSSSSWASSNLTRLPTSIWPSPGARAQFRGFGKVNGSAGYDFILTVLDVTGNGVDKFRIKIWNKTTGVILYDTQMGQSDAADPTTSVGTGSSIVIKK